MKKISRIHLIKIENKKLNTKQLSNILGGSPSQCSCSCCYEGYGGSSSSDNGDFNIGWNYHSDC